MEADVEIDVYVEIDADVTIDIDDQRLAEGGPAKMRY